MSENGVNMVTFYAWYRGVEVKSDGTNYFARVARRLIMRKSAGELYAVIDSKLGVGHAASAPNL
jgi:hypothetical protein